MYLHTNIYTYYAQVRTYACTYVGHTAHKKEGELCRQLTKTSVVKESCTQGLPMLLYVCTQECSRNQSYNVVMRLYCTVRSSTRRLDEECMCMRVVHDAHSMHSTLYNVTCISYMYKLCNYCLTFGFPTSSTSVATHEARAVLQEGRQQLVSSLAVWPSSRLAVWPSLPMFPHSLTQGESPLLPPFCL